MAESRLHLKYVSDIFTHYKPREFISALLPPELKALSARGYVWVASIKSRDRYNDALAEWLYWLNHARLPHIRAEGPRRLTCVVKTPIRWQNRRTDSANESATCIRRLTPSRRGYAASWRRAATPGPSAPARLPQASRSSKTRILPASPRGSAKRAPPSLHSRSETPRLLQLYEARLNRTLWQIVYEFDRERAEAALEYFRQRYGVPSLGFGSGLTSSSLCGLCLGWRMSLKLI